MNLNLVLFSGIVLGYLTTLAISTSTLPCWNFALLGCRFLLRGKPDESGHLV
jgi:hypothetical protein